MQSKRAILYARPRGALREGIKMSFFEKLDKVLTIIENVAGVASAPTSTSAKSTQNKSNSVKSTTTANKKTSSLTGKKVPSTANEIFPSVSSDYSTTNRSSDPFSSSNYATTNKTSPTSFSPSKGYSPTNKEAKHADMRAANLWGGDEAADRARKEDEKRYK